MIGEHTHDYPTLGLPRHECVMNCLNHICGRPSSSRLPALLWAFQPSAASAYPFAKGGGDGGAGGRLGGGGVTPQTPPIAPEHERSGLVDVSPGVSVEPHVMPVFGVASAVTGVNEHEPFEK